MTARCRIVVLLSGTGSNFQALLDAVARGAMPADIVVVISNRPDAGGLAIATAAGIPTRVLDHTRYADRASFDQALLQVIDAYQPQLLVLAGFMRILTPAFVNHYRGRLLNIHPSLLPRYQGLNTHQRAIDAGDQEAGATVHFVTEDLDGGPSVLQARVPVLAEDSAETLAARVLTAEHRIYPLAVQWFAEARLQLRDGLALLDGQPLPASGVDWKDSSASDPAQGS